jgi:hypothetical protein
MRLLLISFALLLTCTSVFGQCKSFTKNSCRPELAPFIANENYNSTLLIPGDEAEINLTFYEGQEYRLLFCNHPVLGPVSFRVFDDKKNQLFSSDEKENQRFFDFKTQATQQLTVKVTVPVKASATELIHEGCVTVMVGYKE